MLLYSFLFFFGGERKGRRKGEVLKTTLNSQQDMISSANESTNSKECGSSLRKRPQQHPSRHMTLYSLFLTIFLSLHTSLIFLSHPFLLLFVHLPHRHHILFLFIISLCLICFSCFSSLLTFPGLPSILALFFRPQASLSLLLLFLGFQLYVCFTVPVRNE
jgi:hypothetical protein